MREVISFNSEEHTFSVINSLSAGFDPLEQRKFLGVKWIDRSGTEGYGEGMVFRGFWFDITDADPLTIMKNLGTHLVAMIENRADYILPHGVTPMSTELEEADVSDETGE